MSFEDSPQPDLQTEQPEIPSPAINLGKKILEVLTSDGTET